MPRMPQYNKNNINERYIILTQNNIKPTPTPEPTPVIGAYIYFYNGSFIPTEINTYWEKAEVNYSIKDTGVKHTYDTVQDSYIAFTYPVELGELNCIYQNDASFNILGSFEQKIVYKNGMQYYLYYFKDIIIAGIDTFEFLW